MAQKEVSRRFNNELYRHIQRFNRKQMAESYAKGLRKKGVMGHPVKVRVTYEAKGQYPYWVWVRGK